MPMQDNINEIYRMRQEAYDRKCKELEDKIKQCDLNMFASSKDKSEPDEEFRTIYLQRCELLRQYREKYGKKAEYQLRDQLDEARKAYVKRYEAEEQMERQKGQINELKQQLSEIIDVKRLILDELYKFPAVDLMGVLLELQQREARKRGQK